MNINYYLKEVFYLTFNFIPLRMLSFLMTFWLIDVGCAFLLVYTVLLEPFAYLSNMPLRLYEAIPVFSMTFCLQN
jgi:hypothetical protein